MDKKAQKSGRTLYAQPNFHAFYYFGIIILFLWLNYKMNRSIIYKYFYACFRFSETEEIFCLTFYIVERGDSMSQPKVSVIIPCYNAEKYLNQCLDSIAAQTLEAIEIICVDDGSTDRTPEILLQYADQDPRFTVLTQENKNAGAARNNGLRIARGEYLSFLDADDFFEPEMLEKMAEAADRYAADFVVCHSDQYLIDQKCLSPSPWVIQDAHIPPYMPFTYRQLTTNVFRVFTGWAWDKLYRRSFIEDHSLTFQEQRTTNDLLFVYSALVLAKKIAVIDGVYAHQRRGGRESLSVTREKSWHCFYDALIALRQRLKDEDLYWELERDFINYALHFSLWNLNTLAEPTHRMLKEKLREEWFRELGIAEKNRRYFFDQLEYLEYCHIVYSIPWIIRKIEVLVCRIYFKLLRIVQSYSGVCYRDNVRKRLSDE